MSELSMYRGDTARFVGAVNEGGEDSPRDITDDTLWFTAKVSLSDADNAAPIQLVSEMPGTAGTGIWTDEPETGVYYIEVPPALTASIALSESVVLEYDVQLVTDEGRVYTIDRGTLTVTPDVTRT